MPADKDRSHNKKFEWNKHFFIRIKNFFKGELNLLDICSRHTRRTIWFNFCAKIIYFCVSGYVLWLVINKLFLVIDASIPGKTERFIYTLLDKEVPLASYAALFTALTSFIASIIVIPVTITQYLFNRQEDSFIVQILKFSAEHNEEVRKEAFEVQERTDKTVASREATMEDAAKAMQTQGQEDTFSTASQNPKFDKDSTTVPPEDDNDAPLHNSQ
ncbi:MAG: hypothetical protein IJD39_11660 [Clostridia bacterium]|nr:hypothetical protein [Clostridia bacterium]